jgi:hypothetical protein
MAITVRRTQSARDYHVQSPYTLYARVNFNTVALTSGKQYIGVLPPNAYPFETVVRINTTFDQPLCIGTAASTNAYVQTGDVEYGTTGAYHVDRCASVAWTSGDATDTSIYVLATTVPTVGQADIWVHYLAAK